MELSVIVIGKNNGKTLERCLKSVLEAIKQTVFLVHSEVIFVDSLSTDDSVAIAQRLGCEVVQITKGFTTAALGRNLGIAVAQYAHLLFLDGDMELDAQWLNNSKAHYEQYEAIRGIRHEVAYVAGKVIEENPNFDQITTVKPMVRPGGFLQISRKVLGKNQFTSILRDEEESDLYAQFIHESKIYQIPIPAYKHHNYKELKHKILDYLTFERHTGYIISLVLSLSKGYINGYIILQLKYFLAILSSILFYIGIITLQPFVWLGCLVIILFDLGLRKRSLILITVLFPFKFIAAMILLFKQPKSTILWKEKQLEIEVSKLNIEHLTVKLDAQKV